MKAKLSSIVRNNKARQATQEAYAVAMPSSTGGGSGGDSHAQRTLQDAMDAILDIR